MNVTPLNSSALSQYTTSLLDQRSQDTASPLSSVLAAPPLDLSGIDMEAILAKSQHGQRLQHRLDREQADLGKALLAELAQQGLPLSQEVSFSVGADGALSVTGASSDVDRVRSLFERDTSQPSLHDRLSDLLQNTQALSTAQTSNTSSMASRYASASNVMALYRHQDDTFAKLTLSAQGSSLSYVGMFSSKA